MLFVVSFFRIKIRIKKLCHVMKVFKKLFRQCFGQFIKSSNFFLSNSPPFFLFYLLPVFCTILSCMNHIQAFQFFYFERHLFFRNFYISSLFVFIFFKHVIPSINRNTVSPCSTFIIEHPYYNSVLIQTQTSSAVMTPKPLICSKFCL